MSEEAAVRDPDSMSVEDLRDEVWFWRSEMAATLLDQQARLKVMEQGGRRGVLRIRKRIASLVSLLETALAGDILDTCFACALPIREGDACISDVNEGEMHAQCPKEGRPQTVKPGDKVFLDPEAIVWEGEGPKPDHLVAHAAARLFTTANVVERVAFAKAAIEGKRIN